MLPTTRSSPGVLVTLVLLKCMGVHSDREHKVHNIVLYPEKHSWCQVTPIQQIIASPGFDSVTIDNNVCVGACYSYSIPKTQPAEPGELIGPYCDSCQPSKIDCYHVNLLQDDNTIDGPKILQKRVQIISNCSCQSCDKIRSEDCQISDENTSELPRHLFTNQDGNLKAQGNEELPDILETNNGQTDTQTQNYKTWAQEHHEEVESLYRLFMEQNRENNDEVDEISENKLPKPISESVPDIVSSHHSFLLDQNVRNNAKIEQDSKSEPAGYGLEGAASGHKGGHVAMGLGGKSADSEGERRVMAARHHHLHNHHLGDVEYKGSSVLHLINGPHGSMVAAPVKAELHIDSDELQPNSEGVVIDYGNPRKGAENVAELFEH